MKKWFFLIGITITTFAFANTKTLTFHPGQDYQVLETQAQKKQGPVEIIEFFNYGCPSCYGLEKELTVWQKKQGKNIIFKKVPVTFNPEFAYYAKVYYIASVLGIVEPISPAIFRAIHEKHQTLATVNELGLLFKTYGVDAKQLSTLLENSPGIDAQLSQSEALMRQYHIMGVPTFIIGGRYETNTQFSQGDAQRLLAIVDFLIQKAKA